MALQLPPNFKSNIEGKSTALFPVVIIGNFPTTDLANINLARWINSRSIQISTNVFSQRRDIETLSPLTSLDYDLNTLPILLNIPSLKESIDIEKRNYKISSINLDISNYKYEGKRFSELVAEHDYISKSLINVECRIFWWSPSTDMIIPEDVAGEDWWHEVEGRAMHIYNGTIREYTMTDDKVKLVVEDRSQATLHRDLPVERLGDGDEIPDKYKNAYKPFVYGKVDRSPLVQIYHNIEEAEDDEMNVQELQLLADSSAITENGFTESEQGIGEGNFIILSALYFYDNGAYWNVQKLSEDEHSNFEYEVAPEGSYIRLDRDTVPEGENENTINNDFSLGQLDVYIIRRVKSTKFFHSSQFDGDEVAVFENIEMGKITGRIDVATDETDYNGWSAAYLRLYLDELTVPQNVNEKPETKAHLELVHYNYYDTNSIPTGETANVYDATTKWEIWRQDQGTNSDFIVKNAAQPPTAYTYEAYSYDSINGNDSPLDLDFATLTSYDYFMVGIPKHLHSLLGDDDQSDYLLKVNFTLKDAFLVHRVSVDGVLDKEYYADVKGRGVQGDNSPKAPVVISDILNKELGQDVSAPGGDYPWYYAFTINEKINSKKLIEGLASASPYLPRFDYLGNFKFDVIKEIYSGDGDHLIKEEDIVSFSYGRSSINDVYSRVEFKYNWNYGRGDFDNNIGISINDNNTINSLGVLQDYDYSYYGFGEGLAKDVIDEDINEGSTLVIDDDRGKYIRNDATAESYALWMLLWHCNQHLKIKVKLPLSAGLPIEVGDTIKFDNVIGGVKPYGIDYRASNPSTVLNGQIIFSHFMVLSTNKTLDSVTIEVIQMHSLETCASGILGCDGICDGAEVDICGDCGGSISDPAECVECPEGVDTDCNNVCGGTTTVDECGTCGGNGFSTACGEESDVTYWQCQEGMAEPDLLPDDFIGEPVGDGEKYITLLGCSHGCDAPDGCVELMAEYCDCDCSVKDVCDMCNGTGKVTCSDGIQRCPYNCPEVHASFPHMTKVLFNNPYDDISNDFGGAVAQNQNLDPIDIDITFNENSLLGYEYFVDKLMAKFNQSTSMDTITYVNIAFEEIPSAGNITVFTRSDISLTAEEIQTMSSGEMFFIDGSSELLFSLTSGGGGGGDENRVAQSDWEEGDSFSIKTTITWSGENDDGESWQGTKIVHLNFIYSECLAQLGDMNGDGLFNILDIITLVNCVLSNNCADINNGCAADLNGDGNHNILDVVTLVNCVLNNSCGA